MIKTQDLFEEIINEMSLNGISRDFIDSYVHDNQTGYLTDLFSEHADSEVNVYTIDLIEWAKDNIDYIDMAAREYGNDVSFIQLIKQGQYYQYSEDLNNDLEDIIKFIIYKTAARVQDDITIEQIERLEKLEYKFDKNDRVSYIQEAVKDVLEDEKEN